jgi:hypothetical protein
MNADPSNPKSELTPTQQAMLDLALACDLRASDPNLHEAMRTRHRGIRTQRDAADYIREVENKIHSRRRFKPSAKSRPAPAASGKPPGKPRTITAAQTGWAILLLLGFMVATGWFAPPGLNLVLVSLSLLLMLAVLGLATTGRPLGVLINERNLMSLARFQTVVWTVIVLGAYLTFALVRIRMMATGVSGGGPIDDPLAIAMDWHLWALLGFSTTSLVGAPLILSSKKDQQPLPAAMQKAAQQAHEPADEINANRHGTLYANASLADARLTDLFEGDEVVNTARLDLAKVQMFYFTVIAAICFFVMVFKLLAGGGSNLDHLPVLPDGLVAILGISHAGYLGSKGIARTQTQPTA